MGGKHAPISLSQYVEIYSTVMARLRDRGYVEDDTLEASVLHDALSIEGVLQGPHGMRIEVRKRVAFVSDDPDPLVQTVYYKYNVRCDGLGNVFRYDCPHAHRPCHHVHRYDVLNGDTKGTVEELPDQDAWPVLSEVIEEAAMWAYEHAREIERALPR